MYCTLYTSVLLSTRTVHYTMHMSVHVQNYGAVKRALKRVQYEQKTAIYTVHKSLVFTLSKNVNGVSLAIKDSSQFKLLTDNRHI